MAFINWGNSTPEEMAAMAKRRQLLEEEAMYEAMRNSVRQSPSAPGATVLGGGAIGSFGPDIIVSATALSASLEYNGETNGPSGALSFTLSGVDLQSDITVTAPTNFQLSTTENGTYSDTLTFTATNNEVATSSVFVRLKSSVAVGDYTGNVTLTTTGASTTVACVGKVWDPTLTVSVTTLTGVDGTTGADGTAQTFTISGDHLRANVSVSWNNTTDFELSLDGTTYSTSSLTVAYTNNGINGANPITGQPKTIYVRMNQGGSAGAKTATITIASTDATSKTVAVSGTKS